MTAPDLASLRLPDAATVLLAGRHPAVEISEALIIAYWLYSRDDAAALYHYTQAHAQFRKLAADLGYTVQWVAK
jgi:hypothetical protein